MRDEAAFVYYNPRTNHAWPESTRNDLGNAVLLFTCAESDLPETQDDFAAAATYYGVKHARAIHFTPGLVPF